MKKRELLFKLTAKDFRWDYYVGTGKGGQNRNKTENCVRCTHEPSGSVGKSEEGRSKDLNKKKAFERCVKTDEFQRWVRAQAMKASGELALIDQKTDTEMLKNTLVQIKDENGKWVNAPKEMQINNWDVKNAKEES